MLNRYRIRLDTSAGTMMIGILCAVLVGCGGKALAEVSEAKAESDLQEFIHMNAGSLTDIGRFEVLNTESPFEGRLHVDTEVEYKANEAALTANVGEHNLYMSANRPILLAKQADGRIEKLRLTYKQISDDVWELQDIGVVPSKYALEQRESGIGPTERQVQEEFGKLMEMATAGNLPMTSLEIAEYEALANDHVRLKLSMQFKGNVSKLKDYPKFEKNAVVT